MSFSKLYLLHGKGGSSSGTVKHLKHAMVPTMRGIICIRPDMPHGRDGGYAGDSVQYLESLNIREGSLLIGISMGGLVAAKLQETSRPDLSVICISSPTYAQDVQLECKPLNRIALYSSSDQVIAGRTNHWPELAEALDLPWLSHNTDLHLGRLAPVLADFVNSEDDCGFYSLIK